MAIFKCINRGAGGEKVGYAQPDKLLKYLIYAQDENGHYIKDTCGEYIPRTDYVSAINANTDTFCKDCRDHANVFGVNKNYGDLKYKHYMQGFSPEDSKKMTESECHQMGVEFAKTFYSDFPVLIVTHFEQEADSGGAHWHNHFVVYNCNVTNGRKLNTSGTLMREEKRYIISQALAHGLSDKELRMVDGKLLSSGSPDKISSAEYYNRKNHQKLLDMEKGLNKVQTTVKHTYYTQLQELRIVIANAAIETGSDQNKFRTYLRETYDVDTKVVRGGEISYLHPDRARADGSGWIRGRTLGNAYKWENIENADYKSHFRQITGRRDRGAEENFDVSGRNTTTGFGAERNDRTEIFGGSSIPKPGL